MSKYYKVEDVISFLNTYCPKDMWEYQIADLPTIEVSEDCISRADLIQDLRKDAERVEMEEFANDTVWRTIGNAPSVIPQMPNEDAISREWLLNFFVEIPDDYTLTIGNLRAVINDAPSVIPKTQIETQNSNENSNEDAISKAYLEQEIENQTMTVEKDKEYWRGWNNALDKVVELIEDAPRRKEID